MTDIPYFCRLCREMLADGQDTCPFCDNAASPLDDHIGWGPGVVASFDRRMKAIEREEDALAAGSRRAKTAKPVECEASQSGAKRNAQRTPHD